MSFKQITTYWAGLAIVLISCLLPSMGNAQPQIAQTIYTLPQLTDIALTHNPSTQVSWGQVKQAAATVGINQSAYWPQLNAALEASYPQDNCDDNDDNCKSFNQTQFTPSLNLNYLLLDFGTRANQVKNAHYLYTAANFTQNETVQQVILQVSQAYYQLLGQQALVTANQISLKEAQASLKAADAMHKQGLETIGDVYQAKSALAQAQLALEQSQGNLSIAQGQLAQAAGLPMQPTLRIADLPQQINAQPYMQNMAKLLAIAKQQRPDLLAAQAQVQAANANVKAVNAQAWPTLQLTSSLQQDYPRTHGDNNSSVMLTLTIPIFTGFQQTNNERLAKAQAQTAIAQEQVLEQQVAFDTWQAYYNLQTAYQSIQISETFLQSSIEAAKQAFGQYHAGVGNILSVLTTQTSEANARVQAIQAKLNWYIALAQMAAALGTLTTAPTTSTAIEAS
jgi:outer membrane protein TolC